MKRPKVIVSEHLSDEPAAWLAQRCDVVACRHDDPGFRGALADAEGLVVRTYTMVNEELLSAAPKLRIVGRAGVGLDNIDVEACERRGIKVVSTPDANTQAVVEYVLALMADALRPRVTLDDPVDSATWEKLRAETVARRQMSDRRVGILGLGRVGRRLAQVAAAIGCEVIYNDLVEIDPALRHGARLVPLEELFHQSHVLSIHIDGRASNRGFVSADLIRRMKRHVVFINTSRGFVVDAKALGDFMERRMSTAKAMIDVHEPEPFGPDYPLLNLPNVKLFPHLASRTETAMLNMSWVVRDVAAALGV